MNEQTPQLPQEPCGSADLSPRQGNATRGETLRQHRFVKNSRSRENARLLTMITVQNPMDPG